MQIFEDTTQTTLIPKGRFGDIPGTSLRRPLEICVEYSSVLFLKKWFNERLLQWRIQEVTGNWFELHRRFELSDFDSTGWFYHFQSWSHIRNLSTMKK